MTTLSRKRFCCEEEDIFDFSNLEIEIVGVNKEVKGIMGKREEMPV
jgi:hypothetical protein